TRSRQTPEFIGTLGPPQGLCDRLARGRNMVVAGPSNYVPRFVNSLIVAFGSTVLAVALGTLSAYGFSRFRVPMKDDLLFFILSTRMMPPIAVAIPIYLMYRTVGLSDTRLGMILLYTSVNVSLAVRRCSWCRSSCSRCCCASISCAASPLEPSANEPPCESVHYASGACRPDPAARSARGYRHLDHRRRRRNADAAIFPDAVHL